MKRVTIHDVAAKAGVSISTVHQALNGKNGVSEATRERILEIAENLGYQPNIHASNLKRKSKHIVVFLPSESRSNRYFYQPVWKGVRDAAHEMDDWNVNYTEVEFYFDETSDNEQLHLLRTLIQENKIDGILTVGHLDLLSDTEWEDIRRRGIAVAQISSDNEKSHSIFCVQPNYEIIGRTMAELVFGHIPSFGSIVLCAGNPDWSAHNLVTAGFCAYMQENGHQNKVYYQHSWDMRSENYQEILSLLRQPDVAACCSVLSQASIQLGEALEESGKWKTVFAVGSDLSEENMDRLNRGVFRNLVQKNPYAQGYIGMKMLIAYLAQGISPDNKRIYVGSEVIFRSMLPVYRSENDRSFFLIK